MTNTDRLEFAQAFNRLAVSTRLPTGEADAAMQQVYWTGLEDMPIEFVVSAADALSKASQWFPKVAEWREWATRLRLQSIIALPDGRDEPWHDECEACGDTGWEIRRCYPGTPNTCGHRNCVKGKRLEHNYAERCTCRPTNRTFQRHQATIASRA